MSVVVTEPRDGWLRLRLNRPPHHALTWELCEELAEHLRRAAADSAVRAVVLDSTGPAFCAGADLKQAEADPAGFLSGLVERAHVVCELLLTMPKPLITAAPGFAAGGGLGLFLTGDVRLAHTEATFHLAYPRVGMCMDCGSSLRLPQLGGLALTQLMLFEGFAPTAERADFVTQACEDLETDLLEWAERLAKGPTEAWATSKALLCPPELVRAHLAREAAGILRLAQTADAREGIGAFLGRREPAFQGR